LRPDLALSIFTRAILTGQSLPLFGDGSIRRDFTHVSDLCSGLISALTAENVAVECINLGHSDPMEVRRLIELLEGRSGNSNRFQISHGGSPALIKNRGKEVPKYINTGCCR
jgi:UDP-glucuronate 4-epimerase